MCTENISLHFGAILGPCLLTSESRKLHEFCGSCQRLASFLSYDKMLSP